VPKVEGTPGPLGNVTVMVLLVTLATGTVVAQLVPTEAAPPLNPANDTCSPLLTNPDETPCGEENVIVTDVVVAPVTEDTVGSVAVKSEGTFSRQYLRVPEVCGVVTSLPITTRLVPWRYSMAKLLMASWPVL
jgi:hypothetical protein